VTTGTTFDSARESLQDILRYIKSSKIQLRFAAGFLSS